MRGCSFTVAVFVAVLVATRARVLGDTEYYVSQIVPYLGQAPTGNGNLLWEFGHLLWRPLGWVLTTVLSPLLSSVTDWTPYMQASFVLISIGVLSGIVTVALWYLLIADLAGSDTMASLVALGFAFSHGFLLYAHSGCAYIPGLAAITGSLYALRNGRIVWGAVLYALGTLLWFPFILAGAALLIAAAYRGDWRAAVASSWKDLDLRRALRFSAVAAVCIVMIYGAALAARDISSVSEAKAWAADSQHGWVQSIRFIRIGTGLPRSFLFLGRDGVLYRRFLFHDPYAPVSMADLVRASLWKIAVFDVFAFCLLYELLRRPRAANWVSAMLALAAVPVLIFAVFLFEPGSPERYLPALPFLLMAVAWVLRDLRTARRITQWVIVGFLVCVALNNGYSFFRPLVSREDQVSSLRVEGFRSHLTNSSVVVVLTIQDPLDEVVNRSPFGSINRPFPLPIFDAVEGFKASTWRARLAERFQLALTEGGQVWVSKRLWSPRPLPEWYWVEGEDPQMHWADVPRFARQLETDADSGGDDGFRRLAQNQSNRQFLAEVLASIPERAARENEEAITSDDHSQ